MVWTHSTTWVCFQLPLVVLRSRQTQNISQPINTCIKHCPLVIGYEKCILMLGVNRGCVSISLYLYHVLEYRHRPKELWALTDKTQKFYAVLLTVCSPDSWQGPFIAGITLIFQNQTTCKSRIELGLIYETFVTITGFFGKLNKVIFPSQPKTHFLGDILFKQVLCSTAKDICNPKWSTLMTMDFLKSLVNVSCALQGEVPIQGIPPFSN